MEGLGLFTSKIHHHASFSGYEQLIEYVEAEYVNALLRTFDQNLAQRAFIKLLRQTMTVSNWYHWQDFKAELAVRRYIIDSVSERPLIHMLYGDSMLSLIPTMKAKYDFQLMATIHACPADMGDIFARPSRLSAVDHFILLAPNQYRPLIDLGVPEEKISVVPHGIDLKNIQAVHQQRNPDHTGDFQSDQITVLGVGNWRRDFALYNQIFKACDQYDQITFKMVVPDYRRSELEPTEQVTILSDLSDEELVALYDSSDVLLMAVRDAAANNVILEAMAHGLPIVGNQHAALEWYSGEAMRSFGSPKEAANILYGLWAEPEKRIALSEQAYQQAKEYDWQLIAERMNDLYQQLLNQ
jgi:glycosyltransferase involved in cell wall biosynthesis